ncbi:hypothetical protein [Brevundimonas sp.]
MLTALRRHSRRARPVVLTERGQMLAGLLFFLAFLLWICVEAKA